MCLAGDVKDNGKFLDINKEHNKPSKIIIVVSGWLTSWLTNSWKRSETFGHSYVVGFSVTEPTPGFFDWPDDDGGRIPIGWTV